MPNTKGKYIAEQGFAVKSPTTGAVTEVINSDGTLNGGAVIDALSITAAKLASDAVETAKIKDSNVTTAKIADGAVTYAKRSSVAAVTATDDGLTTGIVPAGTTFASITSAGATKAVTLPAATAGLIGQTVDLYVGANGYELLTPASSNATINTVDSDGTNQLDVAANTLLRCIQVTATGWAAYQVAATAITVVAPDND